MSYVQRQVKIFEAIDNTGGTSVPAGVGNRNVMPYDLEIRKDDFFAHSTTVNPGEVEILVDGWYKIGAAITTICTDLSGGARGSLTLRFEVDAGSGFTLQPDSARNYQREDADPIGTTICCSGVFQFSAGDKVRIVYYDSVTSAPPNYETDQYGSRLLVEFIE